jgi:hypothetical protein
MYRMICTELSVAIRELTMGVKLEVVGETVVCTSEKSKTSLTIKKANNGTGFWCIVTDSGVLPAVLSGLHTSYISAEKAVVRYIVASKETVSVHRDKISQARDERKNKKVSDAAEISPEGSK